MYIRIKRHQGRLYYLYSEDGSTWIDLQGEFDLVFNAPAFEIQHELLQATVLSIKTSESVPRPWDPPEATPADEAAIELTREDLEPIEEAAEAMEARKYEDADATQEDGFVPHEEDLKTDPAGEPSG
jgi:hypothetical protein